MIEPRFIDQYKLQLETYELSITNIPRYMVLWFLDQ